jgi:hypothetical protein
MVHFAGQTVARVTFALALLASAHAPAAAQTIASQSAQSQVGFYGGASIDPEQGFVGVFWQTPSIGNRFHFRGGLDGGFGNDLRLATINLDFVVRFPLGTSGWSLVQGAGPVIVLTRIEGFDGTDTSAGGSYLLGFAHDSGFFGEFRVGGGNVPSLKMGAGYALKF